MSRFGQTTNAVDAFYDHSEENHPPPVVADAVVAPLRNGAAAAAAATYRIEGSLGAGEPESIDSSILSLSSVLPTALPNGRLPEARCHVNGSPLAAASARIGDAAAKTLSLEPYVMTFRVDTLQAANVAGLYATAKQTDPNGFRWHVTVYYYGFRPTLNDDAVDVSVFLTGCGGKTTRFEFSLKAARDDALAFKDTRDFDVKTDWGNEAFVPRSRLPELLDEDGILELEASVRLVLPVEAANSKLRTGMVGLLNQGATCYLNSLIQTLYHTKLLREEIYKVDTSLDKAGEGVALELQRLFYYLQTSTAAQSTLDLTTAFGWTSLQVFTQQDVQELLRNLLDTLEARLKGTPQETLINRLFCGRMVSYVTCLHVDCRSTREEDFFDIQLQVKGVRSVTEAFEKYVETERLEGDNQYESDGFGKQDADKGVSFLAFPPVLHLHLKRFDYDWHLDRGTKINDKFRFDATLALDRFLHESAPLSGEPYEYTLHSVLVHEGDVTHGHYYSFVRVDKHAGNDAASWFKFNDDVVSQVTERDAVADNFGGPAKFSPSPAKRLSLRNDSSAYMLVYVRTSRWREIMGREPAVPPELEQRFRRDVEDRADEQKKAGEAKHALEATIVTMADVTAFAHFGPRPVAEHYDADVCEWGERAAVVLGDARYLTVAEADEAIRREARCSARAVVWTSTRGAHNTRRVGVPLSWHVGDDLATRYLEISAHAHGYVLVDDSPDAIEPPRGSHTFLVREYVSGNKVLGGKMVAVPPLALDDTLATLFDAVRKAFSADVAALGLLVTVKEPIVLLAPEQRAASLGHRLAAKGCILLFTRKPAPDRNPLDLLAFSHALRDGVAVTFRGLHASDRTYELPAVKKNWLWTQITTRLLRCSAAPLPVALRFFLPAALDPAVPQCRPVVESDSLNETLRGTAQNLPRPEAMGTLGLNGRVTVFYQPLPFQPGSADEAEHFLFSVAVFAPAPANLASGIACVKGRWDHCTDVALCLPITDTLLDLSDQVLLVAARACNRPANALQLSRLFLVKHGVAHQLVDPAADDPAALARACSQGCAVFRSAQVARVMPDGLIAQVDFRFESDMEPPHSWLQVQTATQQVNDAATSGVPLFVPLWPGDNVGTVSERALERLYAPADVVPALRLAWKDASNAVDFFDVKSEPVTDAPPATSTSAARVKKVRLQRDDVLARELPPDMAALLIVHPQTDKPKNKNNNLTIRSS